MATLPYPPPSPGEAGSLPASPVRPIDVLTEWGAVSRGTASLIQAILETEAAAKVRRRATEATQQLDRFHAEAQEAREREAGRALLEAHGIADDAARRRRRILTNRPADRLTNFHPRNLLRKRMKAAGYPVSAKTLKATLRSELDPPLSLLASIANAGGAPIAVLAEALAAAALVRGAQLRRRQREHGNSHIAPGATHARPRAWRTR